MTYLGDYVLSETVYFNFTSRDTSGVPTALTGGAVSIYKDNDTTQTTTGVTLTAPFDFVTGLNNVAIATSDAFYATGTDFSVVLTAGTVNGISVVGEVLAHFSLNNRSALRPTTAGRTLDVTSGGAAGVDWGNVENPSTSVGLTGTAILATVTVTNVTTLSTGAITAASFGAGAIDAAAIADNAIDAGAIASNAITSSKLATDCIGAAQIAADAIGSSELAASAANEIADAYLDRTDGVETGITPRGAQRAILATTTGVITDAATTTNTFKNPGGGTTRVTSTTDSSGNRSAVTLNV